MNHERDRAVDGSLAVRAARQRFGRQGREPLIGPDAIVDQLLERH
jgi:hypothetical protein